MLHMEREYGVSYTIDVKHCNPVTMRSRQLIQDYVISLCKQLEIERVDDCSITVLFDGTLIVTQALADGLLWGKFLSTQNHCHIGLLCGIGFDLLLTANYTLEFFGGREITTHYSVKY